MLATDAVTIHFHGQLQKGTVWQDGIGLISSCPIAPKTSFTYRFKVNSEPGTYFYHGHVGGIRSAGLYGMFIINPSSGTSLNYDEEQSLLLSDWYHGSHLEIATGLLEEKFRWAGDPQSVLINGKGYYNCTANSVPVNTNYPYFKPSSTVYCADALCPGNEVVEVSPNKVVRLRLGNVAELSFLNIAIQGHNMTVIEADGQPVSPIEVENLDINSGQRYSVLINTTQAVDAYWISVRSRHRSGIVTGYAVLKYSGSSSSVPSVDRETVSSKQPRWDDSAFSAKQQKSMKGTKQAPASITRRIVLMGTQERFRWKQGESFNDHRVKKPWQNCDATDKHLRWALNGITYKWENTPVAHMMYYNIRTNSLNESRGYYTISQGDVIEIIIQNYPACNKVCEQHPWHLHGHKFWVVGMGNGLWNGSDAQLASLDPVNAIYRDTTTVLPDSVKPFGGQAEQGGCGWTAVRFVADNPGVWPFHCHVTWHFIMGMQVVFLESANQIQAPGDDIPICGEVTPGVWKQKSDAMTSKKSSDSCDISVELWVALIVGWCFCFGLIIALTFFCKKLRADEKAAVEFNLQAINT
ncbi:uncharacterized protein LOC135692771 isoform X2 [Rhopilema esculentum]